MPIKVPNLLVPKAGRCSHSSARSQRLRMGVFLSLVVLWLSNWPERVAGHLTWLAPPFAPFPGCEPPDPGTSSCTRCTGLGATDSPGPSSTDDSAAHACRVPPSEPSRGRDKIRCVYLEVAKRRKDVPHEFRRQIVLCPFAGYRGQSRKSRLPRLGTVMCSGCGSYMFEQFAFFGMRKCAAYVPLRRRRKDAARRPIR